MVQTVRRPAEVRTWVGWLIGFLALIGLYRLLVGPDDPVDWCAGVIASALAMAGVIAILGQLPPSRIRPVWAFKLLALAPRMLAESLLVARSAARVEVPAGRFEVVAVDPGGDDAESIGRRGLVIVGVSLTPNSVAITLDREHRAILVHRLLTEIPPGQSGDREWPL